jgi:predicted alpha/beta superfamily hydrolase
MKTTFLFLAFILFACSVVVQESDQAIKIGKPFTLHSKILNEDRSYWIYLPDSYHTKSSSPKAYSVLYLLNGDAHFHWASGVV